MISFNVEGNFTKSAAERIVESLNGTTYMNFKVYASNCAGNYTISVETEYDTTEEEAKGMFFFKALNVLAGF